MKHHPIPNALYANFEQMVTAFEQRLSGIKASFICKKQGISEYELTGMLAETGTYLLENWNFQTKQGNIDPAPETPSWVNKDSTPVYCFISITQARKSKKFWLLQLAHLRQRYATQIKEEKACAKPIHVVQLGLSNTVANRLLSYDISTVKELLRVGSIGLLEIPNLGVARLNEVNAALAKYKLLDTTDQGQSESVCATGWAGFNKDGSLDLIGSGSEKTIQLDGNFTCAQLERLVNYMKTQG